MKGAFIAGDILERCFFVVIDTDAVLHADEDLVGGGVVIQGSDTVADGIDITLLGEIPPVEGGHDIPGHAVESRLGSHPYVPSLVDGQIDDEVVRQSVLYTDMLVDGDSRLCRPGQP